MSLSSSGAWHLLDIRLGRIISAAPFPAARKPAYQLQLDFGAVIGTRQTSAQLVTGYPDANSLVGKLAFAVLNFAPRKIAGLKSEVLVLGFVSESSGVSRVLLMQPTEKDGLELGTPVTLWNETRSSDMLPQTDIHVFEQAIVQAGSVISGNTIQADTKLDIVPTGKGISMGVKVVVLKDGDNAIPLSIHGLPLTVDEPHNIPDGARMA